MTDSTVVFRHPNFPGETYTGTVENTFEYRGGAVHPEGRYLQVAFLMNGEVRHKTIHESEVVSFSYAETAAAS